MSDNNLCIRCGNIIDEGEEICEQCKWELSCSESYEQEPTREMLMDAEII